LARAWRLHKQSDVKTLDRDSLEAVTGAGEGKSWGQWVGDNVVNTFFPSWGVQGQTPTPSGGAAQYRAGESPQLPKMQALPAIK